MERVLYFLFDIEFKISLIDVLEFSLKMKELKIIMNFYLINLDFLLDMND